MAVTGEAAEDIDRFSLFRPFLCVCVCVFFVAVVVGRTPFPLAV